MPRYIDADAHRKFILSGEWKAHTQTSELIRLDEAPTADVQPVKHECWVHDGEDRRCSGCKAIIEKDEWLNHNWYFCYHCGAIMDKEEEKK